MNKPKNKKEKYIVIYSKGLLQNYEYVLFKSLKEVEKFIVKTGVSISYIGEYKPLKIKLEVKE